MSTRIPYWATALADPKGIETAQRLAAETLVLDKSILEALDPAVSLVAAALLLGALVATVQILRRARFIQNHRIGSKVVLFLGVLAYWSLFGITIFRWRF